MIRTKIDENCKVEEIPDILVQYLGGFSEVPDTNFIVAGYAVDADKKEQKIYKVNVKTGSIRPIKTSTQGATWDGETYTVTRLIKDVALKNGDGTYKDLPYEEILW